MPYYPPASTANMSTSVYDTDNDNIVDNSETLGGNLPTYYQAANAPITGATVGDATHIPIITYDSKGLITSTSSATISASGATETFAFFNGVM